MTAHEPPEHRVARHLSDDERERLDEDWRRQVLDRLRRRSVDPDTQARADAVVAHLTEPQL